MNIGVMVVLEPIAAEDIMILNQLVGIYDIVNMLDVIRQEFLQNSLTGAVEKCGNVIAVL